MYHHRKAGCQGVCLYQPHRKPDSHTARLHHPHRELGSLAICSYLPHRKAGSLILSPSQKGRQPPQPPVSQSWLLSQSWQARVTESVNPGFCETLSLSERNGEQLRKAPAVNLWLPCTCVRRPVYTQAHIPHMSAHTYHCTYTHTCT